MSLFNRVRTWLRRNTVDPVDRHFYTAMAAAFGADDIMPGGGSPW